MCVCVACSSCVCVSEWLSRPPLQLSRPHTVLSLLLLPLLLLRSCALQCCCAHTCIVLCGCRRHSERDPQCEPHRVLSPCCAALRSRARQLCCSPPPFYSFVHEPQLQAAAAALQRASGRSGLATQLAAGAGYGSTRPARHTHICSCLAIQFTGPSLLLHSFIIAVLSV